jgi:hypothetical protein
MNTDPEPRFGRLRTQDACAVPPQGPEQVQLFAEVERLVVEPFGVGALIDAHQQRALQGDGPLDAIRVVNLGVGQVGDDLQRTPPAGDWSGENLLRRHAGHGGSQVADPLLVGGDQVGGAHGLVVPLSRRHVGGILPFICFRHAASHGARSPGLIPGSDRRRAACGIS